MISPIPRDQLLLVAPPGQNPSGEQQRSVLAGEIGAVLVRTRAVLIESEDQKLDDMASVNRGLGEKGCGNNVKV